jgi:hypothetical protein
MQAPIPYSIKKESLETLVKKSEESLQRLSKTVLDGLKPPSGAYAFFNHTSHALSRVRDIEKIIQRMFDEVRSLAMLSIEENRTLPKESLAGTQYPESVQAIMKKSSEINGLAQLDMESLYIFGQILLDQWSLLAIAVNDAPLKKIHPFVELLNYFETDSNSSLKIIWDKYKNQMLWLHYQVRFYRNRFIIHANRPWQRGTTRLSYGEEYNLFTPTPPGWLDDKKLDEEIKALLPLAPSRIKDADDDYWEKASPGRIIEVLFNDIGNISKSEDRDKIAELFGKKGGSTPTFQVIAKNILEFFSGATDTLNDIAKGNLSRIDLGKPSKTSEEMWKERDE